MSQKVAVIDLGTNTFQLLIAEQDGGRITPLFRQSGPSRIGQGGINRQLITDEAMKRALDLLHNFRQAIDRFGVADDRVFAFGTSAIRNARNQADLTSRITELTRIPVTVIDGESEASYIYHAVRAAGALDHRTHLVMDIGGGSVEFILGDQDQLFWKQSFEIGGQRLMDKFPHADPMPPADFRRIRNYLEEQLIPLANAVHQYQPVVLTGVAGTFDTLADMRAMAHTNRLPPDNQYVFDLSLDEFRQSYELLLSSPRDRRLQIPGMIELRVDMIPVAMCLIAYVLETCGLKELRVSRYSLKEGVLAMLSR